MHSTSLAYIWKDLKNQIRWSSAELGEAQWKHSEKTIQGTELKFSDVCHHFICNRMIYRSLTRNSLWIFVMGRRTESAPPRDFGDKLRKHIRILSKMSILSEQQHILFCKTFLLVLTEYVMEWSMLFGKFSSNCTRGADSTLPPPPEWG